MPSAATVTLRTSWSRSSLSRQENPHPPVPIFIKHGAPDFLYRAVSWQCRPIEPKRRFESCCQLLPLPTAPSEQFGEAGAPRDGIFPSRRPRSDQLAGRRENGSPAAFLPIIARGTELLRISQLPCAQLAFRRPSSCNALNERTASSCWLRVVNSISAVPRSGREEDPLTCTTFATTLIVSPVWTGLR